MSSLHVLIVGRFNLARQSTTTSSLVWSAVLIGLLVWLLVGADSYFVYLATTAVIASLLVLSAGMLAGDTGMFSLCQVSFAAVAALVLTEFASDGNPLPILIECVLSVLSVLTAGAFGVVVALPALRLRSVNLAVVTFGLANAVDVYISARGFPSNTVSRPSFASSGRGYLIFASILVALVFAALGMIRARHTGASWRSVRYSERATAALGVSVVRAKTTAFGVSAMIAGLGGVLTVLQLNTVSESTFPASQSLLIFAVAIFIGGWRWQGALLAGVMSVFIPYISNQLGISQAWGNILFAVGAIQALAGGSVADALWPHRSVRLDTDAVPDFTPELSSQPGNQKTSSEAALAWIHRCGSELRWLVSVGVCRAGFGGAGLVSCAECGLVGGVGPVEASRRGWPGVSGRADARAMRRSCSLATAGGQVSAGIARSRARTARNWVCHGQRAGIRSVTVRPV